MSGPRTLLVAGSAAALLFAASCAGPETMEKPAMEINGLKTIVVGDDNLQLGCMKSSLDHLGVDVSLPWLAGSTGHAFIISMTRGLCPSTPWNSLAGYYRSGQMTALGRNVGFELEVHAAESDDPALASKKRAALRACRDAIGAGRPCYGYYNFHYQMIAKVGEAGLYTVKGQGPLLSEGKGGFEVCIVRPGKPADDRTALKDGLTFALAHAEYDAAGGRKYGADAQNAHGLAAYDRWIAHIEKGDPGDMWRAAPAWYACRSLAADCLAEAQTRIPDETLTPLFRQAEEAYAEAAEHLKPLAEKFTERTARDHKAWLQDEAVRKSVLEHLRAARTADEKAMSILVQIAGGL